MSENKPHFLGKNTSNKVCFKNLKFFIRLSKFQVFAKGVPLASKIVKQEIGISFKPGKFRKHDKNNLFLVSIEPSLYQISARLHENCDAESHINFWSNLAKIFSFELKNLLFPDFWLIIDYVHRNVQILLIFLI